MNKLTYALDCETTGFKKNPKTGRPDVIELSTIEMPPTLTSLREFAEDSRLYGAWVEGLCQKATTERFRPEIPIANTASKIHGMYFKDLLKCRPTRDLSLPPMEYMIAHNAGFDYRALGKPEGVKVICTMSLAKTLDKQLGLGFQNHKLDTLIYNFYGELAVDLLQNSHQAESDTIKVVLLLGALLKFIPKIATVEDLYQFQQSLQKKKPEGGKT